MKVMSIVAWVLVVVLLIGAGALGFLNSQQSGRAAGLRDALAQVAGTAGLTDLAADTLKDPAKVPEVLQQVQAAIQGTQQELTSTKDALAASQTEATGAKGEAATLKQGVEEQTAKAEAAAKELAAQAEELAAAKAAGEKAGKELKEAKEKLAEVEAAWDKSKAAWADEAARLQGELDAANAQVAALEAAAAAAEAPAAEGEMEAAPAEGGEAAAAEEPEAAPAEPVIAEGEGDVLGLSQIFALIKYSEQDQTLFLRLRDGQTLTYEGIPANVADQLGRAGDILDKVFLFKVQGIYKSLPPDSIVIRKYWRGQRYKPETGEVRGIGLTEPPAAERAAEIPAEAPAEAPAEEAAPAE